MKITIDTNCLVDLELKEEAYPDLQKLIDLHNSEHITIYVSGISASERMKDGTIAKSFSLFKEHLSLLSVREFCVLKPLGYYDITYWDHCIYGDDNLIDLERKIH